MADKLRLLVGSHEFVSESGFRRYLDGGVIQLLAGNTRTGNGSYLFLNIQTDLMCRISFFRQFSDREHPAHVAHISRQGRGETLSAQCEVVWRRVSSVVSREYAAHEDFHAASEHPENAQTPLQAHQTFYLDREFYIRHSRTVYARNLFVSFCMGNARTA